jgi:DNA-directed RNA polymerase subunit RPC12/RpoP
MTDSNSKMNKKVITAQLMTHCPHCGVKLSSWEQVLLNVDHTLMCKNCWYRIILDIGKMDESKENNSKEEQ